MSNQSKTGRIKAIILSGNRDFGRYPLATRLPRALWPVAEHTAIEHLLTHLANQGIQQVSICYSEDMYSLRNSIHADPRLELKFPDEPLPVGPAGCIRNAAGDDKDSLLLVFPAAIINPPEIDELINAHHEGRAELTVFLNPNPSGKKNRGQTCGIYVCNPAVLEYIPKNGFSDIKEGLIPKMLRAGKKVHAVTLKKHAGNFRNRQEYLYAVGDYLNRISEPRPEQVPGQHIGRQRTVPADKTNVEPGARICGPVKILKGAGISNGAVIIGPTIIGNNVTIGENTVVVNSVLWDGARIEKNCQVQRCVMDYNTILKSNTAARDKSIACSSQKVPKLSPARSSKTIKDSATKLQQTMQPRISKISKILPARALSGSGDIFRYFLLSMVLCAFLWSYWPDLVNLWKIWMRSDEYSSGTLVPLLAIYILWTRKETISKCPIKPSVIGVFIFLLAQLLRLAGQIFVYGSAERLSIALSIAALVLLLFGWQLFKKVATTLLFLCLMLPWPNRVQAALSLPLQRWATSSAVFLLELTGYEIIREGNIIHIGQSTVAVAEACNGLRMITAFFVITGLVVLLAKRAWWEKLILLISSLPIALLCNTIRLAITAVFFTILEGEQWEKLFHDFGGYAMMPLAVAAVIAELWLLEKLTTPPETKEEIIITRHNQ
ncbi:MAG: exosortase [Sedimentisphaerales bacterium]|nr:exosortase [Sedimentisphaerales bacterium]